MNITIGNSTKANMAILEIQDFPFSQEQLSSNYRRLMKQYHPDNGGSNEKTKQITSAYSELKNLAVHVTDETAAVIRAERRSDKENIFERIFWNKCEDCKGTGKEVYTLYNIKTEKDEYRVRKCFKCSGTGEIKRKPFNPVIPAGAVMR